MSVFPQTIVITGPTATGKTALAVRLARTFSGEIVSIDSRQVFRCMDLGTGKDLEEYAGIPYHLIDVADARDDYDLYTFVRQARAAIADIRRRNKLVILCGGSTMYLDALLRGYALDGAKPDMELRKELDALDLAELNRRLDELAPAGLENFKDRDNHLRVRRAIENAISNGTLDNRSNDEALLDTSLVLGVYFPRNEVHQRIEARLDARLAAGMVDEVADLHQKHGVSFEKLERFGLEYRWIAEYLQGKADYETMRNSLLYSIRKFAKRQDIWFRKMEREGMIIHWLKKGDFQQAKQLVQTFLDGGELPPPAIKISEIFYGPRH